MNYFNDFPDNARVWIYPASRELTKNEVKVLLDIVQPFVASWDSHGTPLKAAVDVLENQFLVIAVDEDCESPSGCSIDRSVKKIKEIGNELKVDFFNRLNTVVKKGDEKKIIHFSELSNHKDWSVFNTLTSSVGALNKSFLVPVEESGFLVQ